MKFPLVTLEVVNAITGVTYQIVPITKAYPLGDRSSRTATRRTHLATQLKERCNDKALADWFFLELQGNCVDVPMCYAWFNWHCNRTRIGESFVFLIMKRNRLYGCIELDNDKCPGMLGYALDRRAHGVMTPALTALLEHVRASCPTQGFVAAILSENTASQAVVQRLGFIDQPERNPLGDLEMSGLHYFCLD